MRCSDMSYWYRQKKLTQLSSCTILALLFSFNSLASTKVDEIDLYLAMSPSELSELSVSIATGTAQPIFQSASVTSVVTAQQIKAMGATELHEILETIPGLHVSIQANTYDYIYTMRGIRNSTNSQVLVLLDGNRFSVPFQGRAVTGLKLPIENIQKIEVIRGPGSALYGADAFAGVINIITKKAKDIDGTLLGGRVGNWNSQSIWTQHGGHWAGWDVATSVQYQHSSGDDKRIITKDSQSFIDAQLGTNASHAPDAMQTQFESWNAHLNLQRKHWDIGFWASNGESGVHAGAAAALDLYGKADTQQYLGSIKFSSEDWFDNWEFLAHVNYLFTDFQTNQLQLFPNDSLIPIGDDGNISFNSPSGLTFFTHGVNDKIGRTQQTPTIELSSIYRGFQNHRLRFQAGYRYEKIKTRESKNIGLVPLLGGPPPEIVGNEMMDVTNTQLVYLPNSSRSIWSLATQDEWQIAKNLQLTTGFRFDHYSDFGATFNPRVALVWDINKKFTSKLLYGRAFRAPSFTELGIKNNPVLRGNPNLKPEIINTIELAFDYRPFQSLRTALNLYYYSIKDLIEAESELPSGSVNILAQNNGHQKGYGLEFEWNWQLHEQFIINGNYAWQNAHHNAENHSVPGVPQQQLYIASQWDFLPKWSFQSQIKWIGKRTNEPGDTRKNLKDYEMIDLTLRGKKLLGHLNLTASVRNLFNKHAREPSIPVLIDQIPTSGRSFYFEASIDF